MTQEERGAVETLRKIEASSHANTTRWNLGAIGLLFIALIAVLVLHGRFEYIRLSDQAVYVRDRWSGELKFCRGPLCYEVHDFENLQRIREADQLLKENNIR